MSDFDKKLIEWKKVTESILDEYDSIAKELSKHTRNFANCIPDDTRAQNLIF